MIQQLHKILRGSVFDFVSMSSCSIHEVGCEQISQSLINTGNYFEFIGNEHWSHGKDHKPAECCLL